MHKILIFTQQVIQVYLTCIIIIFTLLNSYIHYLGGMNDDNVLIPGKIISKNTNRSFIDNNTFVCEEFELVCATEFSIECQICNLDQYTVVRENQLLDVFFLSSGQQTMANVILGFEIVKFLHKF